MDLIEFNNIKYPAFQSQGNAAQFAIPYAKFLKALLGDFLVFRIQYPLFLR